MSSILTVAPAGTLISSTGGLALGSASVITQYLEQVKDKDTSQLINGISNVFQKLLRCFNETENSTSFVFPSLAVFPVILALYLKDLEFFKGSTEISLV